MKPGITVYGAAWCEDTQRTRQQLDDLRVAYQYVDIDRDKPSEKWITEQNNGKRKTPTVDVAGMLLFEPSNEEMEKLLRDHGLL